MFDNVGRDLDEEAGRRQAQSLLVSVLGLGAVVGFVVGITAYTAADLVLDPEPDGPMAPVVLAEPDLPMLPPPPPPPAAAKARVEPEEEPEPEPDPDSMPEDLHELSDDTMRSAAQPPGVDGGEDGGDPDGELGGVQGGGPDGTGSVLGGPGPRAFHHSELETKRRVQPIYPKAAKTLSLGSQRCKARVKIDSSGVPYDIVVEDCPAIFHAPTREALLQWRWYAPRDGRQKVAAQTVIYINYTLR